MRAPVRWIEEALRACLRDAWGIDAALRPLLVGGGGHHWAVASPEGRRFVTVNEVDAAGFADLSASLRTAHALAADGVPAVAPLLGRSGDAVVPLLWNAPPGPGSGAPRAAPGGRPRRGAAGSGRGYAVSVYPFVDGRAGRFGETPPDAERVAVVEMLARVHGATGRVPAPPRREIGLARRAELDAIVTEGAERSRGGEPHRRSGGRHARSEARGGPGIGCGGRCGGDGPLAEAGPCVGDGCGGQRCGGDGPGAEGGPCGGGPYSLEAWGALMRGWWGLRRGVARFDALCARVVAEGAPGVVTHGEPHPGNLVRAPGGVVLVDWETVGVAPPERDLWMSVWPPGVVGDGAESFAAVRWYERVTGRPVSRAALELYRLRWCLDDITLFAAALRAPHSHTADTANAYRSLLASLAAVERIAG